MAVDGRGRKSCKTEVYEWRQENPAGTRQECAEALGKTYQTILRWWDWDPSSPDNVGAANAGMSAGAKANAVYDWRQLNPEGHMEDAIIALDLTPSVVFKYWDWKPAPKVEAGPKVLSTISYPEAWAKQIDELGYKRTKFIREAIREKLDALVKETEPAEAAAEEPAAEAEAPVAEAVAE